MAKIYIKEFTTFNQLFNHINQKFTHFNKYIFRGHADNDWKLNTTLARSIDKVYPNTTNIQALIDSHLNSFKLNIRGKSKINFKDISDNDLWAIGQHFGLNTPLLDFTKSPYVALFFALQGVSESGKRCLWAISERELDILNVKQLDENLKLQKIIPFTNDNPRLVSQQGLFLKVPLNLSIDQLIEEHENQGVGVCFHKLVFNESVKNDALMILQNMNISQLTLFPDLIGSALHSNYLFEIEPHAIEGRKKAWDEHAKKNSIK